VTSQLERTDELLTRVDLALRGMRTPERSSATVHRGAVERETAQGLERALRLRRETVVRVDQPLALISQAQRSGGTLLERLFDGHPQCHVHPDELHIGDTRPHVWPELDLDDDAGVWFSTLQERRLISLFSKGRRAVPLKKQASKPGETYYPFMLPPAFQRRLFLDEVERRRPITSSRAILDCYMTSLFNGWLDNQNLRGADKRWVVAFSPRRAWGERLETLFELYPDGRLISILRDPLSWYTSAEGRSLEPDPERLVELWKRSVAEMLEASRRHRERVSIVRFEALVRDTEATMRNLADFLKIDFDPQLTVPTFNRHPTGPNSSYEIPRTGLVTDPLERYKKHLSEEQQEFVRGECEALYEEALSVLSDGDRGEPAGEPAAAHGARA
jgi:Sulfotransferase family